MHPSSGRSSSSRLSGDAAGAAEAELLLGELADDQGDAPRALPHFTRAASLVEALPTSQSKAEVFILNALRLALADEEGASRYAEEGLAMAEELGSLELRAAALDRLGVVRTAEGDVEAGLRLSGTERHACGGVRLACRRPRDRQPGLGARRPGPAGPEQ